MPVDITKKFKFADLTSVGSPKDDFELSKGLEDAAFNMPGGPDKINFYAQTNSDADKKAFEEAMTIYKREQARLKKIDDAKEDIRNILKRQWRKVRNQDAEAAEAADVATSATAATGGGSSTEENFRKKYTKFFKGNPVLQELQVLDPAARQSQSSTTVTPEANSTNTALKPPPALKPPSAPAPPRDDDSLAAADLSKLVTELQNTSTTEAEAVNTKLTEEAAALAAAVVANTDALRAMQKQLRITELNLEISKLKLKSEIAKATNANAEIETLTTQLTEKQNELNQLVSLQNGGGIDKNEIIGHYRVVIKNAQNLKIIANKILADPNAADLFKKEAKELKEYSDKVELEAATQIDTYNKTGRWNLGAITKIVAPVLATAAAVGTAVYFNNKLDTQHNAALQKTTEAIEQAKRATEEAHGAKRWAQASTGVGALNLATGVGNLVQGAKTATAVATQGARTAAAIAKQGRTLASSIAKQEATKVASTVAKPTGWAAHDEAVSKATAWVRDGVNRLTRKGGGGLNFLGHAFNVIHTVTNHPIGNKVCELTPGCSQAKMGINLLAQLKTQFKKEDDRLPPDEQLPEELEELDIDVRAEEELYNIQYEKLKARGFSDDEINKLLTEAKELLYALVKEKPELLKSSNTNEILTEEILTQALLNDDKINKLLNKTPSVQTGGGLVDYIKRWNTTYNPSIPEGKQHNIDEPTDKIKYTTADFIEEFDDDPEFSQKTLSVGPIDRIIFIVGTFFIRAIILFMVQWGINSHMITTFHQCFTSYIVGYIALFLVWVLIANIPENAYEENVLLSSIFYYINTKNNKVGYLRIIIHILLQIILLPILYIIKYHSTPIDQDSFEQRRAIYNAISNVTFFIWLMTTVVATRL
jgi:hypothetical protein